MIKIVLRAILCVIVLPFIIVIFGVLDFMKWVMDDYTDYQLIDICKMMFKMIKNPNEV